jgi:hypothetical protein
LLSERNVVDHNGQTYRGKRQDRNDEIAAISSAP